MRTLQNAFEIERIISQKTTTILQKPEYCFVTQAFVILSRLLLDNTMGNSEEESRSTRSVEGESSCGSQRDQMGR
jgi:hypothetical protein